MRWPEARCSSGAGGQVSDTARAEAFSDGVLAVAITLLVLDLHTPAHGPGGLLRLQRLLIRRGGRHVLPYQNDGQQHQMMDSNTSCKNVWAIHCTSPDTPAAIAPGSPNSVSTANA